MSTKQFEVEETATEYRIVNASTGVLMKVITKNTSKAIDEVKEHLETLERTVLKNQQNLF